MTKYYKQQGSVWDTYYAVSPENCTIHVIEARYTDTAKAFIDTYITASNSVARGTYDIQAAEAISEYEAITAKEWSVIKKEVGDYIKTLEGQQ